MLSVVNFELRTFCFLDPYGKDNGTKYFQNFKEFLIELKVQNIETGFDDDTFSVSEWNMITINYDRQPQDDGNNCGVYVLMYIQRYLLKTHLTNLALCAVFRNECKRSLIENVEIDICLYCMETNGLKKPRDLPQCKICQRHICTKCALKYPNYETCLLCENYLLSYS